MEKKEIASDSGHWYSADGSPAYTIKGKNGVERSTTLRDARKLGLLPSVSTITGMLPKPGLDAWKQRQVLLAALTSPAQADGESHDDYIARIMADAAEQARVAREKGTAIHGAIERHLQGQRVEPEYQVFVDAALNKLLNHLSAYHDDLKFDVFEAEKSFACDLGYGGKVDLHSRALNVVADFKTKEFDEGHGKLAWDEHLIQLEAYRKGLGMPDARMLNIFVSTSVPGLVEVVEHPNSDPWAWQVFRDCLTLWQTLKKYKTNQ